MGKSSKKEANPDSTTGETYLQAKFFEWGQINSAIQKQGVIKFKKGKKSFAPKYVALHFNYLLVYKQGKAKSGEPATSDVPKSVIALERVTGAIEPFSEKGHQYCFSLSVPEESYYGCCETSQQQEDWVVTLRYTLDRLRDSQKREPQEATLNKMKEVQKVFPESWTMPSMVTAEQFDKWLEDMKKSKEDLKTWEPFMQSLTLFAEFQIGRPKAYHSWFFSKTKGVSETLARSEEMVLANFSQTITKAPFELQLATETVFYKEDLGNVLEKCENVLKLINNYNRFVSEYRGEKDVKFADEKKTVEVLFAKFASYPSMHEITVEPYDSGSMIALKGTINEEWSWDKKEHQLIRISSTPLPPGEMPEIVEFSSKGHPAQFVNQVYGVVLWNGKSWVWTHPRCPFIIRFDWFESKKVFKQHFPLVEDKKKNSAAVPSLSDWQLTPNGTMNAVQIGQRDTVPEVPPVLEWSVKGNIPPPVALIIANFYAIKPIMRAILGWY